MSQGVKGLHMTRPVTVTQLRVPPGEPDERAKRLRAVSSIEKAGGDATPPES